MSIRHVPVILRIEEKEDVTGDDVRPGFPAQEDLAVYLKDLLNDHTKHDGMIGYRITGVTV